MTGAGLETGAEALGTVTGAGVVTGAGLEMGAGAESGPPVKKDGVPAGGMAPGALQGNEMEVRYSLGQRDEQLCVQVRLEIRSVNPEPV